MRPVTPQWGAAPERRGVLGSSSSSERPGVLKTLYVLFILACTVAFMTVHHKHRGEKHHAHYAAKSAEQQQQQQHHTEHTHQQHQGEHHRPTDAAGADADSVHVDAAAASELSAQLQKAHERIRELEALSRRAHDAVAAHGEHDKRDPKQHEQHHSDAEFDELRLRFERNEHELQEARNDAALVRKKLGEKVTNNKQTASSSSSSSSAMASPSSVLPLMSAAAPDAGERATSQFRYSPEWLAAQRRVHGVPDASERDSIFVSIASYRDHNCPRTLVSLFDQAADPTRVFVGLVQQNWEERGDVDCLDAYCRNVSLWAAVHGVSDDAVGDDTERRYLHACTRRQVRMMRVAYADARGPTWARWAASQLYAGESYFMMIDSHSVFHARWDARMIRQVHDIEPPKWRERAVLSHHPPGGIWEGSKDKEMSFNYLCTLQWVGGEQSLSSVTFKGDIVSKRSMPRDYHSIVARDVPPDDPTRGFRPMPAPFIGAGFVFANASFLIDVPFDPYLTNMFAGEEFLLSARAFAAGYVVHAPTDDVMYHDYYSHPPRFSTDPGDHQSIAATARMHQLLGINLDAAKAKLRERGKGVQGQSQEWYRVHEPTRLRPGRYPFPTHTLDEFLQYVGVSEFGKHFDDRWCKFNPRCRLDEDSETLKCKD